MRALSCLLCIIEIIKINSRSSSIMMLTSCGAGRLMERNMKFTDIIFMKHEEDFQSSGIVFSCAFDKFAQRGQNAALHVNFGSTIASRFRKIHQLRSRKLDVCHFDATAC